MQRNNNVGHSADSYIEKMLSIEPGQNEAGVGNSTVPRLEDQAETKTQT